MSPNFQDMPLAHTLVYGAADQYLGDSISRVPLTIRKAVNRLTVVPKPDWKAELQAGSIRVDCF